jgi:hypothetical protein
LNLFLYITQFIFPIVGVVWILNPVNTIPLRSVYRILYGAPRLPYFLYVHSKLDCRKTWFLEQNILPVVHVIRETDLSLNFEDHFTRIVNFLAELWKRLRKSPKKREIKSNEIIISSSMVHVQVCNKSIV